MYPRGLARFPEAREVECEAASPRLHAARALHILVDRDWVQAVLAASSYYKSQIASAARDIIDFLPASVESLQHSTGVLLCEPSLQVSPKASQPWGASVDIPSSSQRFV